MKQMSVKRRMRFLLCLVMMLVLTAGSVSGVMAQDINEENAGVTLTLGASVTGDEAEVYNSLLGAANLTANAGFTPEGALLLNLRAALLGQNLFNAQLQADGERIAFALPDVDGNVYEFSAQKLLGLLQDSFPGSAGSETDETAGSIFGMIPIPQITPEEVEAFVTPYLEYLGQQIAGGMQFEEEAVISLKKFDKELTGSSAVYEPSAEDLAKIFSDLSDMLATDETGEQLVNKFADYLENTPGLETILSLTGTGGNEVSLKEAAQGIRDGYAQLPDILKETSQQLSEEGMEGIAIRLEADTDSTGSPCRIYVYFGEKIEEEYYNGEYYELGFERDPEADGSRVCVYVDSPDEKYDVLSDTQTGTSVISGTISLRENQVPAAVITYEWDTVSKTMAGIPSGYVTLSGMGASATFSASEGDNGGSDYAFILAGLDRMSGDTAVTGVKILLNAVKSALPEAPSGTVVDISDYTAEQLSELFQSLGEKAAEPIAEVFGE